MTNFIWAYLFTIVVGLGFCFFVGCAIPYWHRWENWRRKGKLTYEEEVDARRALARTRRNK
ncbi:MAG TPA: hypothetical protein VNE42_00145 [Acidimicrobiales bacterium]|nr:hypothetical protein [Acidimicrobiales bacterium]